LLHLAVSVCLTIVVVIYIKTAECIELVLGMEIGDYSVDLNPITTQHRVSQWVVTH